MRKRRSTIDAMDKIAEIADPALLAGAAGASAFALTLLGGWLCLRALRGGGCRWRRAPRPTETTLRRWVCAECGVDAFATGRRPPRECKRSLRPAPL